jgi:hypothetical protein
LKLIFRASSNAWNAVSSIDSLLGFFAMRLRLVTYSPGKSHLTRCRPQTDRWNAACRKLSTHKADFQFPIHFQVGWPFFQTDDNESLPTYHPGQKDDIPRHLRRIVVAHSATLHNYDACLRMMPWNVVNRI